MAIRTIEYVDYTELGGPFYAFWRADRTFTGYSDNRVAFSQVGSTGMWVGNWDDDDGMAPYIFQGAGTPTSWADAVAVVDFSGEKTNEAAIAAALASGNNSTTLTALTVTLASVVSTLNNVAIKANLIGNAELGDALSIDNLTLSSFLRVLGSVGCGPLTGAETPNVSFRSLTNSKTRLAATVDPSGNRVITSIDGTP